MLQPGELDMAKSGYVAPSREGLVPVTAFVKPEVRQQLKIAAVTHDTTVAAILEEGLRLVLKKYAPKNDR
jgi:hypothetical protein